MKKKIYVVTYSTEDNHSVVSNFYYTNKLTAEEEAKEYIKKSCIFRKYEVYEISPA